LVYVLFMLYCSVDYQSISTISIQDRGLAYGDGIFTTGKVVNGELELLTQHLKRLHNSCLALKLITPDFTALSDHIKKVAQNYSLAVLKVIITAGVGGRGYSRVGIEKPTVIISVFDFPKHYHHWQKQGITLGVSELQLGLNPMLGGIKHLNRLEQVIIRRELDNRVEDDLLIPDINGCIVETSCANVFWKINEVWQTPCIKDAGIAGLMRTEILARINTIEIVEMKLIELVDVQAMFICNSVMGLVPVNKYNNKCLSTEIVQLFGEQYNLN